MSTILFDLFIENNLTNSVLEDLKNISSLQNKIELGQLELRHFPDGESYLRIKSQCKNKRIVILANLHQPDPKIMPLIYLCETLKELGAASIHLLCPYLPYMRQDIKFRDGECVTSRYFSKLISRYVDSLVTIDPHLHRYRSLDEIYTIKSVVKTANPAIATWVKSNINKPLVIGPDSESEQWAANAAELIDCPYLILEKQRLGDKNVVISAPGAQKHQDRTPVLIDDIISTGRTMIVTADALIQEGLCNPICIGVHALFSESAYSDMQKAPIDKVLSCNTVAHETNTINISRLLAEGLEEILKQE